MSYGGTVQSGVVDLGAQLEYIRGMRFEIDNDTEALETLMEISKPLGFPFT